MVIAKYVVPTLIALIMSSAASAIPANADPVDPPRPHILGADHDVKFDATVSDDLRAAITTLQDGQFEINADATAVAVNSDDGVQIATVPLTYGINGKTAEFTATVDKGGRRLTLRPIGEADAPLRDIDAQQRFFDLVQANLPVVATGAAIGATIGFVAGFPLGLFVLDFITAPLLAVVGGVIGAAIGLQQSAGQPAIDAALSANDNVMPVALR
ncbi:hypothetical protein [Nocardia tengchongensis]|uniref:hypothetical protein n=1 Tax=Nocardia tengchongensis TaxID=2055889 RepID=UPI00364A5C27